MLERLAVVLEQLDLPEISRMLRRTVYAAIVVGVAAFIVLAILGQPLAGLGAVVGLGLGLVNMRLIMRTASNLNASGTTQVRKPMALSTVSRLALTTAVAIVFCVISLPLGFGVLGGIAIFYFLFLASLIRTLFHQGAVA